MAIIEAKASTNVELDLETEIVESLVDKTLRQIRRYEVQSPELFRFVQLAIAYADKKLFVPRLYPIGRKKKTHNFVNGKTVKVEDIHDLLKPK